jgi:PmbA protein
VFEARVAKSLLGALTNAINGGPVAKGTTFLASKMGEQIFDSAITIHDNPLLVRGLGSEPFDGEGVQGFDKKIIDGGKLSSWLLDTRSAKKLGLQSTGSASRGLSSMPHPGSSNVYMEAGTISVKDLISDIKSGFFVTDTFGMGVNDVTGDYSQGAAGFWIENGIIAYPVSEITIAGNLLDMFKSLTPADDLEMLYGTNSPTVRVEGMTVAGA